jgi:integrase
MSPAEIDALIERWMEAELEETEDFRAIHPVTEEWLDDTAMIRVSQMEDLLEDLGRCDYHRVEHDADEILKAAGLPLLEHDSVEFKKLCRRMLRAKTNLLDIERARWRGDYKDREARTSAVPPPVSVPPPAKTPAPSKPFTEVVKLYFQENTRAKRTDSQVKAELERFVETVGGDRPIGAITKADCRMYKEHMLQVRKLTLATVIKHLSSLSGMFKWSEAQGFVADGSNPVRGLAPNKRQAKKQASQRRPFTDDELLTVFGSQEFTAQRTTHPERFWLTLICLFQICRREEAGQLAIKDIGEADGIAYLQITDEREDQGLKNEGSKRRLPVHSSLIQLGFLEYVESVKAAGHTRLFPQLTHGANGYSDSVGKFFSRLVTKAGLSDPALVLHSLRHGGITKLHAAGVQANNVEMLAGHASNTVNGSTYTHRESIPLSLLRGGGWRS